MTTDQKNDYDDIIHLPHHVSSRHHRMSMTERAAQFSPFAALTGYGDVIRETARITERKPELTDEEKSGLDRRLKMACSSISGEKPEISITYFIPDQKKSGGTCRTVSGRIRKTDTYNHRIIMENGIQIDVDCVLDIEGDIYDMTEDGGER